MGGVGEADEQRKGARRHAGLYMDFRVEFAAIDFLLRFAFMMMIPV